MARKSKKVGQDLLQETNTKLYALRELVRHAYVYGANRSVPLADPTTITGFCFHAPSAERPAPTTYPVALARLIRVESWLRAACLTMTAYEWDSAVETTSPGATALRDWCATQGIGRWFDVSARAIIKDKLEDAATEDLHALRWWLRSYPEIHKAHGERDRNRFKVIFTGMLEQLLCPTHEVNPFHPRIDDHYELFMFGRQLMRRPK